MTDQNTQAVLKCSIGDNFSFTTTDSDTYSVSTTVPTTTTTCWHYWIDWYYPQVIYKEYPVYIRERARDKGKQAFEIIKILKDKRLVNLEKVGDFIDLMDELIKIL